MKFRSGFVSNSSSSSFVLIGITLHEDSIAYQNLSAKYRKDDDDYDWPDNIPGYDYLSEDGPGYLGKSFSTSDYGVKEMPFSELSDIAKKMSKDLDIPEEEIKLIFGERYC